MESIYNYEEPIDLLKEIFEILKKILKETTSELLWVDVPETNNINVRLNKTAAELIEVILKEYPEIMINKDK